MQLCIKIKLEKVPNSTIFLDAKLECCKSYADLMSAFYPNVLCAALSLSIWPKWNGPNRNFLSMRCNKHSAGVGAANSKKRHIHVFMQNV